MTVSGVISGDDSQRYSFEVPEWNPEQYPTEGMYVDFDVDDEGQAVDLIIISPPRAQALRIDPVRDEPLPPPPEPVPEPIPAPEPAQAPPPTTAQPRVTEPKSRTTAALFALFFGLFGVHKFYLGYTGPALTVLILNIVGILTLFGWLITFPITGVIALIETIKYFSLSDEEFHRIHVQGRRPWL